MPSTVRLTFCALACWAAVDCGGGGESMGPAPLDAVVITGDSTVVINGTLALAAQASAGGTAVTSGVTYTWSTSRPSVATVSGAGVVTGVARDTVTITVQATTATQSNGPTTTHHLRIKLGGVTLGPARAFHAVGDTATVVATGRDAANAPVGGVAFTWTSSDSAVLTVGNTGKVSAVANGTANITATAVGENLAASVMDTVAQVAVSLVLTPDTAQFGAIGDTLTPAAAAQDSNGHAMPSGALSWTSRNTGVVTVTTAGRLQAVNEGQAYVVASSGGFADSVRSTVALTYTSARIAIDSTSLVAIDSVLITRLAGSRDLAPIVRDSGGAVVPGPQIGWRLLHGVVGTIDSATGLITGDTLTGRDSVILVARTTADTVPLVVRQDLATIAVSPHPADTLHFYGDTARLFATGKDAGGYRIPGTTFTWTSGSAVETVTPGPDTTTLATEHDSTVTSLVAVTITASAGGKNGVDTVRINRVPNAAALSPNSFSTITALGDSVQAKCIVTDSAGVTIPGHPCNWSALTANVVKFDPAIGAATYIVAVGNGTSTVTATAATSVIGFNSVTVQQAASTLKLHPLTIDTSRVLKGGSFAFVDSAFDHNGHLITGAAPTWTSRTTSAATVDSTGKVTGVGGGMHTYIVAALDAGKDSAYIEVKDSVNAIRLGRDVQDSILTPRCASCHTTGNPNVHGEFLQDSVHTYTTIVNVTAFESALKRAYPAHPDSSYAVHKIQGTHLLPPSNGSGVRMPEGCSGASCLSQGQINVIRNWILQGAVNN